MKLTFHDRTTCGLLGLLPSPYFLNHLFNLWMIWATGIRTEYRSRRLSSVSESLGMLHNNLCSSLSSELQDNNATTHRRNVTFLKLSSVECDIWSEGRAWFMHGKTLDRSGLDLNHAFCAWSVRGRYHYWASCHRNCLIMIFASFWFILQSFTYNEPRE